MNPNLLAIPFHLLYSFFSNAVDTLAVAQHFTQITVDTLSFQCTFYRYLSY